METLKKEVELLTDLKRRVEILAFRYYTSNDQSTLINLIADELQNWSTQKPIPDELLITLSNPEKYATNSIDELCLLYKKVVLIKVNPH
jgi:hypothetical protein